MSEPRKPGLLSRIPAEYSMLIVLVLMVSALSLLTLKKQNPAGADAGQQVGVSLKSSGAESTIVVVAEKSPLGSAFVEGVTTELKSAGIEPTAVIIGEPADARRGLTKLVEEGMKIDAIAVTSISGAWPVYDKVPTVSTDLCQEAESYLWPTFARADNIISVANQTAIYAIIAIGMTMVIITAGIDLSVGSMVALSAVTAALFISENGGTGASVTSVGIACLLAMLMCSAAGLVNGIVITQLRVPPFIATLAMMMVARGLARRLSGDESISALPDSYLWIGTQSTFGLPNPIIIMVVLYIIAHITMSRTVFGRYVYSVGGNPEAARLSGVRVRLVTLSVYAICGALAGLGGIMQSSKLQSGDPKLGSLLELDVISAVVVGGTSLMGGQGRIVGTLIGAFIIAIIKNGMNLMNVEDDIQAIVQGGVILAAVVFDNYKRGELKKTTG
ncbi:MAG TPA: sugar-transporting ATPase [Planctomycetaceae bacterium]|nr:sugar-transporting ATPase [Planctomycetaceae bacterium]